METSTLISRNEYDLAIIKGVAHTVALPLILTVAFNLLVGLSWIAFSGYLYARVFKDRPAAYWFFVCLKIQSWFAAFYAFAFLALSL